MLTFELLMDVKQLAIPVLCQYTHPNLKLFWEKCLIPPSIVVPYYARKKPTNPYVTQLGPSKKDIISGIIEEIDRQGNLGALDSILKNIGNLTAEGSQEKDLLRSIQSRIVKKEQVSKSNVKEETPPKKQTQPIRLTIPQLKNNFELLFNETDHQKRGYLFQDFLQDLFNSAELKPTPPFKITGEQIDGGFVFEKQFFICEAKWQAPQVNAETLYGFRGKVEGKLSGTKGMFIAINSFSDESKQALVDGKEKRILLIDGGHLWLVLDQRITLNELLSRLLELASFKGEIYMRPNSLL